jgi:hypothetical protein
MHWVVCERGVEFQRCTTLNRDELLFWVFQSVASSMASAYEVSHRREGEDSRRQLWTHQFELLARLSPDWRAKRINELGSLLQQAGLDAQ